MSLTLALKPTIVDRVLPKGLVTDAALVLAGTGLTALAAQWTIATTPVPITGQTFAVLLVGAAIGSTRAALSMFVYLLAGAAGLGVFNAGKSGLFDETGHLTATLGYLVGFIVASALVGFLAERGWSKSVWGVVGSFVLGNLAIYALGLPWLQLSYGVSWAQTLEWGFTPFVLWDLGKLAVAAGLLPAAWLLVSRVKR